ncbi:MAG: RIP metalloprotease RseP [Alphaproteobacteria bacterium]
MDLLAGVWNYAIPFLGILTVVVFFHEMGHYLIARWNGVRIEVFSIGFGPALYSWDDRAGTRWKLSLIPLGGYVKMFGDSNVTSTPDGKSRPLTPEEQKISFLHKRLSQRTAIVFAGPLANFLLAILLFAGLFSVVGQPFSVPVVSEVEEGSAAAAGGLQPGDRILSMNGQGIERFEDIQRIVQLGLGEPLMIVVDRNGAEVTLSATPKVIEQTDSFGNIFQVGRLGIRSSGFDYVRHGPLTAIWRGAEATVNFTGVTLKALGQMIAGTRTMKDLGGPLRIAELSGQVAEGGIDSIVFFMAVLSINLGLINLFPIPVLDGGHLLFYAIEAIRGKPLGERAQEYGFRIGLALVLVLILFVTWNDLVHLGVVGLLGAG